MKQQILNVSDLGSLIQEMRKKQDLTQEDLSGMTGIGRRFIVDLEKGKETIQFGKVLKIISALGITLQAETYWE